MTQNSQDSRAATNRGLVEDELQAAIAGQNRSDNDGQYGRNSRSSLT
jgi:hypothetical protein